MLKYKLKQCSFYSELYHKIPENHILKTINSVLDFSFVNKMLESSYCKHFGRPAKEPEMTMRILILAHLYNLSDERVMQEIEVNLAYMWFIGINPEDRLPHPSLLTKFRKTHLKGIEVDEIITEIVKQAIEKEIISKENGISIDTTHISANTIKKVPERIMKHLAKKIFKAMGKEDYAIPDYTQIEDHKEAKRVMKEYLEEVIEQATPEAKEVAEQAREILNSDLFIEQKGIRSLIDKDARVGYKTKTDSFYGYKMEYGMTTDGLLITSVGVHNGAYVDGEDFEEIYDTAKASGLKIEAVYGDKAYFKKNILDQLKQDDTSAYIPVNACSYRIDEELYSYNKDSDEWFCILGNKTICKKSKSTVRKGRGAQNYWEYIFDKQQCIDCPKRAECMKCSTSKAKKLHVGLNASEYYEHSQWAKTAEFIEEYKKRAKIENKNAEMKLFHGLARAKGYGIKSVALQAKLTALAVNLKRIAALVFSCFVNIIRIIDFMNLQSKSLQNVA